MLHPFSHSWDTGLGCGLGCGLGHPCTAILLCTFWEAPQSYVVASQSVASGWISLLFLRSSTLPCASTVPGGPQWVPSPMCTLGSGSALSAFCMPLTGDVPAEDPDHSTVLRAHAEPQPLPAAVGLPAAPLHWRRHCPGTASWRRGSTATGSEPWGGPSGCGGFLSLLRLCRCLL